MKKKEKQRILTLRLLLERKQNREQSPHRRGGDERQDFSALSIPKALISRPHDRASFNRHSRLTGPFQGNLPAYPDHGETQVGPRRPKGQPTMLALRAEPAPLQLHQCSRHAGQLEEHGRGSLWPGTTAGMRRSVKACSSWSKASPSKASCSKE